MNELSLKRIRILKTGLANVQDHIDMSLPENRVFFEKLAEPGTQLKLKRVHDNEGDPFRVEVYSPDDRYLGRVTIGKNETTARMMDAGLKVVAVVNKSLPFHDRDEAMEQSETVNPSDPGWNEASREAIRYNDCNLPYCIYYDEE